MFNKFGKANKFKDLTNPNKNRKKAKKRKKADIKPMTLEEIKASDDLIKLYKEKVIERYGYLNKKKIANADVINKDYIKISEEINKNFDKYKNEFIIMLDDENDAVQFAASLHALRTGTSPQHAYENIKKYKRNKSYEAVYQDAKTIDKLYNQKKLKPYPGFPDFINK